VATHAVAGGEGSTAESTRASLRGQVAALFAEAIEAVFPGQVCAGPREWVFQQRRWRAAECRHPHRPREDGLTHPAHASRSNLASAVALLSRWRLSNPELTIERFGGCTVQSVEPQIATTNNPKYGDYQCNNAMPLFAKLKGQADAPFKNPREVSERHQSRKNCRANARRSADVLQLVTDLPRRLNLCNLPNPT
jgi:hypothetical protein